MSMINAKEEFLELTKSLNIYCAYIDDCREYDDVRISLSAGYTHDEYIDFLNKLDFSYSNGYGGQELYGLIWFDDGSWAERGEYDGSEWWEYKETPDIPSELLNNK